MEVFRNKEWTMKYISEQEKGKYDNNNKKKQHTTQSL